MFEVAVALFVGSVALGILAMVVTFAATMALELKREWSRR